jgi:hypothetical protein
VSTEVRLSLLALGMGVTLGCGPEVDPVVAQYEPRVCGQDGPVQILAVDEPPRPLIVGETLMGCDLSNGAIYLVDPHTAERGDLLTQGLQCDPVAKLGATALMRDVQDDTLAIVDDGGNVTRTSLRVPPPDPSRMLTPQTSRSSCSSCRPAPCAKGRGQPGWTCKGVSIVGRRSL